MGNLHYDSQVPQSDSTNAQQAADQNNSNTRLFDDAFARVQDANSTKMAPSCENGTVQWHAINTAKDSTEYRWTDREGENAPYGDEGYGLPPAPVKDSGAYGYGDEYKPSALAEFGHEIYRSVFGPTTADKVKDLETAKDAQARALQQDRNPACKDFDFNVFFQQPGDLYHLKNNGYGDDYGATAPSTRAGYKGTGTLNNPL